MGGARWGLLVVVFTVGLSSLAYGQQNQTLRDRDPDIAAAKKVAAEVQNSSFHYGSFYLQSRLRLADAGFGTDVSVPTGDTSGGVRLAVEAPQRLYYVPHRKVVFSAELIPGYAWLRDGGQFDYSARADAHFLFNHLYLDAYVNLTDKIRAHLAEVNRLATVREDEFGLGGEWKHSSRTSAIFTVRKRGTEYPCARAVTTDPQPCDRFQPADTPLGLLDRDEVAGRIALHHKTFPLTSLFVATELGQYEFKRATFKDSSRRAASAGFSYDSGRTKLRGEAGTTRLDFDDPSQEDFQGMTGSLSAGRVHRRWDFGAGLTRDLGFAIFANNNYFESTVATAGISRRLGRSASVRVNAMRERDEFPFPFRGVERRDDISFYSTGFTYGFWKLGVGSDVGWYERSSTFEGDEDAGIRWLIHLSFTL